MEYLVNLKTYEGPMDLLIDLIKKNEVDIYDIPIHIITEQFLEYIEEANKVNLELTSDFILMASTLIEIKSKMLLPKIEIINDEKEDIDPRDDLVAKILEYEKYKEVSQILKESAEYEAKAFYKLQEDFTDLSDLDFLKNCNAQLLCRAFENIVLKAEKSPEINTIRKEYFPIEKAMNLLKIKILEKKRLKFTEILSENYVVEEVVSYFISLLELIKIGMVSAEQSGDCEDIYILRKEG